MMWVVECNLRRKNRSYIDSATYFMWEPGNDGTPGSRHMVHVVKWTKPNEWSPLTHWKGNIQCGCNGGGVLHPPMHHDVLFTSPHFGFHTTYQGERGRANQLIRWLLVGWLQPVPPRNRYTGCFTPTGERGGKGGWEQEKEEEMVGMNWQPTCRGQGFTMTPSVGGWKPSHGFPKW